MGPSDFIDWVKGKYYALKVDDDIPQSKELAPEKDAIIKAVCDYWDVGVRTSFQPGILNNNK